MFIRGEFDFTARRFKLAHRYDARRRPAGDMQVDVTHHVAVEQPVEVKIVDKDDVAAKQKAADMLETFTAKT